MENKKEVISRVIDYIEEHLKEDLKIDKISRDAGYSPFYLNRLFAEQTGCTMHKYIQKRRLTIAAEQLVRTEDSILEVAFNAGYESQQAFTGAFKQYYLISPSAYRQLQVFKPKQNKIQINSTVTTTIHGDNNGSVVMAA